MLVFSCGKFVFKKLNDELKWYNLLGCFLLIDLEVKRKVVFFFVFWFDMVVKFYEGGFRV